MSIQVELVLGDLVKHTITRSRGQEATLELRRRAADAHATRVCLKMESDTIISTSFIDELVQQAASMEHEVGLEIVFVIPNVEMLESFRKSVTWRNLYCHYRRADDKRVHKLTPGKLPKASPEPQFGTKAQVPLHG